MSSSKPIMSCQLCQEKALIPCLFLGYVPPVNQMQSLDELLDAEWRFPLELKRCESCGLVQIGYEVDQTVLFSYSYPYLSGTTQILKENFQDLADQVDQLFSFGFEAQVMDIGANDGTLLVPFKEKNYRVLGIEPSQAAEIAKRRGIPMVTDYFNQRSAQTIKAKYGQAHIITAANVFAHMTDIHDVIKGIKHLLTKEGVFISESHYLLDLIETLQYDTIYHEHLRYYSLSVLATLMEQHGMEVFRVKRVPTHGGSIRVFAARKGEYEIDSSVSATLALERERGVIDGSALTQFKNRVVHSKLELLNLLHQIKKEGVTIAGVGAPSRASTLINYVGIDEGLIDWIGEVASSHKLNKYIPGTRIPVVSEKKVFEEQPKYVLLFSWHIASELMEKLIQKGFKGDFIIPLPKPRIVKNYLSSLSHA